jgi:hypothetical protein
MDRNLLTAPQAEYQLLNKIATALLLVTVVFLYMPLSYVLPGTTLDESWAWAMGHAQAQHMVIGKDIIFTYGPYAALLTKMYYPDTDLLMLVASIPLAAFAAVVVYKLAHARPITWKILFSLFLAGGVLTESVQFFLYPLLVSLYLYNVSVDKLENVNASNRKKLFCIGLFIPFGLMFLVKGSCLVMIVGVTGLSAALFWYRGMRETAIAICVAPLLSTVVYQIMADQPLSGLWYYTKNMLPIISGYTEAMALPGDKKDVLFYLLTSALILIFYYKNKDIPLACRLFFVLTVSLFLFTAFKAGFTRADAHSLQAAGSILDLGFLLFVISQSKKRPYVLFLLSAACWLFISFGFVGQQVFDMFKPIPRLYTNSLEGLMVRLKWKGELRNRYEQRRNEIKQQYTVPAMQGTTDAYPWDLGYVLASDNTWAPRPVIQSYSAYTDKLAKLNEEHLVSDKAPDNILFAIYSLDNRFPAMDDGLSWPTLINNYQIDHSDDHFLYLKQKREHNTSPKRNVLYTIKCTLGEEVVIPDTTQVLFAEFDIKQTLLGKTSNTLFRPDPVVIDLTLTNGTSVSHRLIAAMAKPGFILSPYIRNTGDFASLISNPQNLKDFYVRSIKVVNDGMGIRSFFSTWQKEYELKLSTITYDK